MNIKPSPTLSYKLNFDLNHLHELEQHILGCILVDNSDSLKNEVLRHNLKPRDFRDIYHQQLFNAILKCWKDGKKVDLLTVMEYRPKEYRGNYSEDNSGIWNYKNIELTQKVVSSAHIEQWITQFKEYIIIMFWNKVSNNVSMLNWSTIDVLKTSDDFILEYTNLWDRLTKNVNSALNDYKNNYEAELKHKQILSKSKSPITVTSGTSVDLLLKGGFYNSELIILAGRPGMLKSTIALILAWEIYKLGKSVMFFTLEMPKNQIKNKIISKEALINYDHLKSGKLNSKELKVALEWNRYIDDSNFTIIDDVKHIDDISREISKFKKDNKVDFVVIDYLQRIKFSQKILREGIIYMTRELKSIANDNYIPVMCLSQLSRKVEERTNKRPILSDLKESSSIEEDADIVIFPYRQAYYDLQMQMNVTPDNMWKCELNIGKGRDIGINTITSFINPITLTIE